MYQLDMLKGIRDLVNVPLWHCKIKGSTMSVAVTCD